MTSKLLNTEKFTRAEAHLSPNVAPPLIESLYVSNTILYMHVEDIIEKQANIKFKLNIY